MKKKKKKKISPPDATITRVLAVGQIKTKSGQVWNEEKKRNEERGRDKEMDEEK